MAKIEITKDLTREGIQSLEVGQILIFDRDGERYELKVVTKSRGRLWAQEVQTRHPDEIEIIDRTA